MSEPERFGSTDQEHFNAAYRKRPILNLVVLGQFLKGLGMLVLAGVSFAVWAAIHNWTLTNPRQ
jgi:hypothetical protein